MNIDGALEWWLTTPEDAIFEKYEPHRWSVADEPDKRFLYFDNGGSVLAVAHLDTVQAPTYDGWCEDFILATSLDDRLGAWMIMEVLRNQYKLPVDVLLTTNEEKGKSTAANLPADKLYRPYNWAFSFDRRGTDVVTYKYSGVHAWTDAIAAVTPKRLREHGSYSCIQALKLGVCAMNIGCGYYDNHTPTAYAMTKEVQSALEWFQSFYTANHATRFEFDESRPAPRYGNYSKSVSYGDDWTSLYNSRMSSVPAPKVNGNNYQPANLHPSEYKGVNRHLGCSKRHQKRIAKWRHENGLCQRCGYPPYRSSPELNEHGLCGLCERDQARTTGYSRSTRLCTTCSLDISAGVRVAIWHRGNWYCSDCFEEGMTSLTHCHLCKVTPVTHVSPQGMRLCATCAIGSDIPIEKVPSSVPATVPKPPPQYKGKATKWPCQCGAINYSQRTLLQWLCHQCGQDFKVCEKRVQTPTEGQ